MGPTDLSNTALPASCDSYDDYGTFAISLMTRNQESDDGAVFPYLFCLVWIVSVQLWLSSLEYGCSSPGHNNFDIVSYVIVYLNYVISLCYLYWL